MVFINRQFDVTMAPANCNPGCNTHEMMIKNATFTEAANIHSIYQNRGYECQKKMCQSMHGCDNPLECAQLDGFDKIHEFCGPVNTGGVYRDGAWWNIIPSDSHEQQLQATKDATNLSVLPTFNNVLGMY